MADAKFKALLEKLQTYIYMHDVHPIDVFKDFDRLNHRTITIAQFRRAFDINRLPASPEDLDLIVAHYAEEDLIHYEQFCSDLSKIYTNQKLETRPLKTTKDPQQIMARALGRPSGTTDQAFLRLLAKLAHQVRTLGVHIREAYMDFDKHNNGNVTYPQFVRANPFQGVTEEDFALLRKYYQDPVVKDIAYRRLHLDVARFIEEHSDAHSTAQQPWLAHQLDSVHLQEFDKPADQVLAKLAAHVAEHRIRLREFFDQHDPLRKGLVTPNKFDGVVTSVGFALTEADLENLRAPYATVVNCTDLVRWTAFCDNVEALAVPGVSQTQPRAVSSVPAAGRVLVRIKSLIQRSKINIAPTLQDFDRRNRGFITSSQFQRALATLKIVITDAELAELDAVYGDAGRGGIDIYAFIEAVDPDQKQSRRSYAALGTTRESIEAVYGKTPSGDRFVTGDVADTLIAESHHGLIPRVGARSAAPAVVEDLKKWAYVKGVHFHEFLQDYDTHNLTEITATQFRRGLAVSTAPLTEDEISLLIEHYKSPTRQGFVQWKKFSQDIMEFVAPLDLEQQPLKMPTHPRTVTCK